MFSNKPNYLKLRTNLRLCINRLKLLEKKKTELALKARREIADYIAAGKEDRARIRVEHIIREDYLVEAMEIVEMLCDLLLARFGLIEKMTELDPGLEEAISTIIWVTPRMVADIQELREVTQQLTIKYGKEFADMCRRNGFENVNEKVVHKMTLSAPPKILVENYMVEIARTYKVPFEADPLVMMGQPPETSDLIELGLDSLRANLGDSATSGSGVSKQQEAQASNRNDARPPPSFPPGSGGESFGGAKGGFPANGQFSGASGQNSYEEMNFHGDTRGAVGGGGAAQFGPNNGFGGTAGGNGYGQFGPGFGMAGPGFGHGSGGGTDHTYNVYDNGVSANPSDGSVGGGGFGLPTYHNPVAGGVTVLPNGDSGNFLGAVRPEAFGPGSHYFNAGSPGNLPPPDLSKGAPPPPSRPPNAGAPGPHFSTNQDTMPSLPPYDDVIRGQNQRPLAPSGPSAAVRGTNSNALGLPDIPNLPDIPGLPSVPTNSVGAASVGGDDIDFDDLTRRFEELKKRK